MINTPDWLCLLRTHADRFADIIRDADIAAPVTFCPSWSIRDLMIHLGGVHQWAAHAVVEGNPHVRPKPPNEDDPCWLPGTANERRASSVC